MTLPIYPGNEPIDSGTSPEKGPLQVFTWSAYINPTVVKAFEKQYKVAVTVTSFENEEEALSKLTTGAVHFDVWFGTVQYLGKSVAGKLIQPLNHRYLPNLRANVWPSLASPYYDVGSRYTVPYVVYTTGISWRRDKVKAPTTFANPYDILWQTPRSSGKVAVIDDQREALGMALLRRRVANVNTESSRARQPGRRRPLRADEARQRQGQPDRLPGHPLGSDLDRPGLLRRHGHLRRTTCRRACRWASSASGGRSGAG